jgi:hypothetical protein
MITTKIDNSLSILGNGEKLQTQNQSEGEDPYLK